MTGIHSQLIGIVGGTGAGKSTLCTALMDKYPDTIGLVQLDDYFKPPADVPRFGKLDNWDHPESLYLEKLTRDLQELRQGRSVTIMTKNLRLNPDYITTDKRIPARFDPKPIMLVEGFLVLWDPSIRALLITSIWLDVDHDTRWQRRVHFKFSEYEQQVALPMHKQFAEPTKQYAKHVINVTNLSKDQVLNYIERIISPLL